MKAQVVPLATTWVCLEWIQVQRAPQIGPKANDIEDIGAL